LDFYFSSGDASAATANLEAALRNVPAAVKLYATVSPSESSAQSDAANLESAIYELVTRAHTHFDALDGPSIISYRQCLTYPASDGSSASVLALPIAVAKPDATSLCPSDGRHQVFLRPNEHFPYSVLPVNGSVTGSLAKTVILGSVKYDTEGQFGELGNPEVVAWAISQELSDNPQPTVLVPQTSLLLLLAGLDVVTLLAFLALFMGARRLKVRARLTLPWAAAAGSVTLTLAIFAGLELFLAHFGVVQPQVTLPALSVLIAGPLCGAWGRAATIEQLRSIDPGSAESYDYDVFISYAHEEGAWVSEHVYVPFRDTILPSGKKLSVYFDTASIRSGTAWQTSLAMAIDGSRFIVPVYSDIYFKQPYCRFEILRAHRKWIREGEESRCVLPIMRGHPAIFQTVDDIQALSIDDHPDLVRQHIAEIVERLSREAPARTRETEAAPP
jgi:hypothetical protein